METDRHLEVGDVVVWDHVKYQYHRRNEYPQPLVVVKTSRSRLLNSPPENAFYVKVRDATGILRFYSPGEHFDERWFVYDAFLTAVHKRKHGK